MHTCEYEREENIWKRSCLSKSFHPTHRAAVGLPAGVALLALAQEGLGQGAGGGSEVEHGRHRLDQLAGLRLQGAKALQLLGHVLNG